MNHPKAQPIYFGPPARPLFGWLHRPPADVPASSMGLVLCNAFGFDAVCSHRTLRHVALAATQLGMNCIRFDYDGTGDSAGDDFDGDRVAAWLASIHAAADELKSRTGVTTLCLLGVRMGGLLAATVAQQRDDVGALALVLPTVKPRSYLREMRAFHAATLNPQPGDLGDGDESMMESVGFLMTAETTRALEQLSCAGTAPPPADVLILDRQDLPGAVVLAEQLRGLGARVVYLPTQEQELLLKSPNLLQLPAHIFESCTGWLAQLLQRQQMLRSAATVGGPNVSCEAIARIPVDTAKAGSAGFIEETAAFSGPHDLFSITTSPIDAMPGRRRGVLFVNSGAVHHIGPARMYVALARQWAAMGYVVMRLDLAGIGDSPAMPGAEENVVYSGHAAEDVIAAVSWLQEKHGVHDVVSAGLCSGAYHSFLVASRGLALRGIILINPLTFYWVAGAPMDEGDLSPRAAVAALETQRYGRSMFKWATWKKLLTGKADLRSFMDTLLRHGGTRLSTVRRDLRRLIGMTTANDLPGDLQRIDSAGTRTVMVFGGADLGLPRVRVLGGAALRRMISRRKVELHVVDGADHTFMQLKHRRMLQRLLTERLRALLPG